VSSSVYSYSGAEVRLAVNEAFALLPQIIYDRRSAAAEQSLSAASSILWSAAVSPLMNSQLDRMTLKNGGAEERPGKERVALFALNC